MRKIYPMIIACLLPMSIQAAPNTKITNKTGGTIGLIPITTSRASSSPYGSFLQLDDQKTIEFTNQKVESIVVSKYIGDNTYGPSQFIPMQLNPTTIDILERAGFFQVKTSR